MPTGPHDKTMLSTKEVADIMGVTSETVRDWINRGRLTGVRLPSGQFRVTRAALSTFAQHNFSLPSSVEVDDGGSVIA